MAAIVPSTLTTGADNPLLGRLLAREGKGCRMGRGGGVRISSVLRRYDESSRLVFSEIYIAKYWVRSVSRFL